MLDSRRFFDYNGIKTAVGSGVTMNELQQVEFEILKDFVAVCEKLGLRYYLVCGSALGAVKYGGFIPWDDDVDVALPRRDYERFCAEAGALLPERLFIQNHKTDPAFPPVYMKLRDLGTTFIEKTARDLPIVHGVYIDVFPLDGYPGERLRRWSFELKKRLYVYGIAAQFQLDSPVKRLLYTPFRLWTKLFPSPSFAARYERMIQRYDPERSALWCNYGNSKQKVEYAPKDQYGQGSAACFEGLSVRVPEKYDDYLTQKYGDWRAELPPEQRTPHHGCIVCDLSRPYTEYTTKAEQKTQ